MFPITRYMRELAHAAPVTPARRPPRPVVVWNLIRRCNLACRHCYSISADHDCPGELSTGEVCAVMDDLRSFGVSALIFAGGEPLLRPDIFEISRHASGLGFRVGLSSNGTLINEQNIGAIAEAGYDHVGISLDGLPDTHDRFRRRRGAFAASLRGMRLCRDAGVRVGIRFTLALNNAHELPMLLRLVNDEDIDRFHLSHRNYAGSGDRDRRQDALHRATRDCMDRLFERAWEEVRDGGPREYFSGNNDADAAYLLQWVAHRFPDRVNHLRARLRQRGGNAAGVNVANIDNLGEVHPDTSWWHHTLGNVRERPFSEIWCETSDPIMAGLKSRPRPLKGRCAACAYLDVCGGNARARAYRLTGDPWAADPGCYLTDAEIGVAHAALPTVLV